jgi:hypothetical protein
MPATALLALVCAFSVLLLLFLDKTLNISLALAFLPLWLLHVWVLIEPICAALLRWKAGYQVSSLMHVSLMIYLYVGRSR